MLLQRAGEACSAKPCAFHDEVKGSPTQQGLGGDCVDSSLLGQQDVDLFGKVQRVKEVVCAAPGIHVEHS